MHREPGRAVKQSVPQRVRLQTGDCRDRIVTVVAEHVVPLQDLVQDDPVHKSSEPDPEQDPGGARTSNRFVRVLLPARVGAPCRVVGRCSHGRGLPRPTVTNRQTTSS